MTRVGIIGAGHIGSTLARGLVDRGYEVVISNSRGPETLEALAADLGPNATAGTTADAATGDFVIVTVPLKAYQDVPVEPLAGKIVLDTNNYYWERDGHIAALDEKRATTTGLLQEHLPSSKVVKAFNHIGSGDILTDGSPAGTPGRRALATASDDPDAVGLRDRSVRRVRLRHRRHRVASPRAGAWNAISRRTSSARPATSSRTTSPAPPADVAGLRRTVRTVRRGPCADRHGA